MDCFALGRLPIEGATDHQVRRGEEAAVTHSTHDNGLQAMSLRALVAEIINRSSSLARKELELAKAEGRADLQSELTVAKGLTIAAVLGLLGLDGLVVALVLALANVMAGWLFGLVVGGAL